MPSPARAATPDAEAVVGLGELPQPRMGDAALRPDALDDAARPRHRALRAGAVERRAGRPGGRPRRAPPRRPGGSPRRATWAVTAPVSSRVRPTREESPNSSVAANAMRFATAPADPRLRLLLRPVALEDLVLAQVRGQHRVALRRARPRRPRSACPTCVERAAVPVTDRPVHQSAQVQRVGPALDERRPVRGVLDAVGEDECLLLRRGDVRAAEQLPERRRGQRGHPRTEEADAVRSPARRALLVLRRLGVRRDDDRNVGAGRPVGRANDVRGLRVDPHHVRGALGRLARCDRSTRGPRTGRWPSCSTPPPVHDRARRRRWRRRPSRSARSGGRRPTAATGIRPRRQHPRASGRRARCSTAAGDGSPRAPTAARRSRAGGRAPSPGPGQQRQIERERVAARGAPLTVGGRPARLHLVREVDQRARAAPRAEAGDG